MNNEGSKIFLENMEQQISPWATIEAAMAAK